jgi:hypothetical protein
MRRRRCLRGLLPRVRALGAIERMSSTGAGEVNTTSVYQNGAAWSSGECVKGVDWGTPRSCARVRRCARTIPPQRRHRAVSATRIRFAPPPRPMPPHATPPQYCLPAPPLRITSLRRPLIRAIVRHHHGRTLLPDSGTTASSPRAPSAAPASVPRLRRAAASEQLLLRSRTPPHRLLSHLTCTRARSLHGLALIHRTLRLSGHGHCPTPLARAEFPMRCATTACASLPCTGAAPAPPPPSPPFSPRLPLIYPFPTPSPPSPMPLNPPHLRFHRTSSYTAAALSIPLLTTCVLHAVSPYSPTPTYLSTPRSCSLLQFTTILRNNTKPSLLSWRELQYIYLSTG